MGYFGNPNSTTETALFILLAVISGQCLVPSMGLPNRLRDVFVIPVYIMPVICILLTYNNIILALGDALKGNAAAGIAKATYSIVVPLYLVVVFEVAYVMHKLRSVKFFGIVFDQGHRVNIDWCSWLWRYMVRMVAIGLMIMGIITNYTIGHDDNKAGTGGYASLDGNSSILFILFLVPSTAVALISLSIGIAIRRYGKNASIVVDTSCCNRWTSVAVGSICVLVGNIPRATIFRVTAQAGLTAFLFTIVLLFNEIEREIEATQQFSRFLEVENENVTSLNPNRGSVVIATKKLGGATVTSTAVAAALSASSGGTQGRVVIVGTDTRKEGPKGTVHVGSLSAYMVAAEGTGKKGSPKADRHKMKKMGDRLDEIEKGKGGAEGGEHNPGAPSEKAEPDDIAKGDSGDAGTAAAQGDAEQGNGKDATGDLATAGDDVAMPEEGVRNAEAVTLTPARGEEKQGAPTE